MPQRKDKWTSLFDGLGRPTKRGIRNCPKCGTVNGTRGNSCKNKACDVVFRDNGSSRKSTTEACKVVANIEGFQIFSVRLRDRGPDYRSFVQLSVEPPSTEPNSKDGAACQQPSTDAKCFIDACVKNKTFPCAHIQATQRCFSESQPLTIKQSVIPTLTMSSEQQQSLSTLLNETNDVLVQRVSKTSFVVKCSPTNKHPLGYLHIMFFRHNLDDGSLEKKFLCTCKPIKPVNRDTEPSQSSSTEDPEIISKFCIHYHACLSAFASDDDLSNEFMYFLTPISQECPPTLLSQLHLVTLPPSTNPDHVGGMDTNHISVEIMQENISLLESIAAADDTNLHNVQSLEGVLSDQIIVTNVDDTLSFGEASGLEGLEDGDSQVCQIFANAQNAIQLAGGYSNAENVHQTVNITNAVLASPNGGKRRKHGSGDGLMDVATIVSAHPTQPLVSTNHYDNSQKIIHPKGAFARGFQGTTMITYTTPVTTTVSSSHPPQLPQPPPLPDPPDNPAVEPFELWLAGVNERLNATMNYQFTGKPDPITYYISTDYFERLRERITSGVKKKRLPNQTVIISRTDKPPAGTFTKHVWKITNIIHVLQIFHNQIIPLKLNQYFIKGNNGIYEEWIPPSDRDKKNQLIKPHVHSSYLKVGKNDPNAVESIPFTIEWIPDILPQSKLGELSIIFEFGRCSNSRDDLSNRFRDVSKTNRQID